MRGNRYVEPLELAVQCCGRVNEMGIPPSMDEDAVRDTYCDVRFDVIDSAPKRVYCLYTGKVFCEFCAKPEYKVPLPQFENLYDNEALVEKNRAKKGMLTDEPEPQQVCYDAKEKMGATLLVHSPPLSCPPPPPSSPSLVCSCIPVSMHACSRVCIRAFVSFSVFEMIYMYSCVHLCVYLCVSTHSFRTKLTHMHVNAYSSPHSASNQSPRCRRKKSFPSGQDRHQRRRYESAPLH